jgi:hypothetical protein
MGKKISSTTLVEHPPANVVADIVIIKYYTQQLLSDGTRSTGIVQPSLVVNCTSTIEYHQILIQWYQ